MIGSQNFTDPHGSGDIENFGQNQGHLVTPLRHEALTFGLAWPIWQSLGTTAAKGG